MGIEVQHGTGTNAAAILLGGVMPVPRRLDDVDRYVLGEQSRERDFERGLYAQAFNAAQRNQAMQFQAAQDQFQAQQGFGQRQLLQNQGFAHDRDMLQARQIQQTQEMERRAQMEREGYKFELDFKDQREAQKIEQQINEVKRNPQYSPEQKAEFLRQLDLRKMGLEPKWIPPEQPPIAEQLKTDGGWTDHEGNFHAGEAPPGMAVNRDRSGALHYTPLPVDKTKEQDHKIADKERASAAALHQKQEAHEFKMFEAQEKRWYDRLQKAEEHALEQNIDFAKDTQGNEVEKPKRSEEEVLKEVRERHTRLHGPPPQYTPKPPIDFEGGISFGGSQAAPPAQVPPQAAPPQAAPPPVDETALMGADYPLVDEQQPIEPLSPQWFAAEPKLKPLADAFAKEQAALANMKSPQDASKIAKSQPMLDAFTETFDDPLPKPPDPYLIRDGAVYKGPDGKKWIAFGSGPRAKLVSLPGG